MTLKPTLTQHPSTPTVLLGRKARSPNAIRVTFALGLGGGKSPFANATNAVLDITRMQLTHA